MMRNPRALSQRHLVGTDVESAIDGRRVTADDLPAQPSRERDAERALPGRCGSDDGYEAWSMNHKPVSQA